MRPGTFIEWDDQSQIKPLAIKEVREAPTICAVSTTDKGPEDWTALEGKAWFNAYGDNISFASHGQPLLQSAMAINSGARLLFKRLVADDACLANIGIVAKLVTESVQKMDKDGNVLYDDGLGGETIESQKRDSEGNPIYLDKSTGKETTFEQRQDDSGNSVYIDKFGIETTESQRKDSSGNFLFLDDNGVETTSKEKYNADGQKLYVGYNGELITDSQKRDETGNALYEDNEGNVTTSPQKMNSDNQLLYRKPDGSEVIYADSTLEWIGEHTEGDGTDTPDPEVTYTPIMNTALQNKVAENAPSMNTPVLNEPVLNDAIMVDGSTKVVYTLKTAVGIKLNDVMSAVSAIKADIREDEYLLWVIADNGRGKSRKRFKIVPNYRLSKNLKYILYNLLVIENGEIKETILFTPNPNQVRANENISLADKIKTNSTQITAYQDEESLVNFLNAVAETAGITAEDTSVNDYIFCRTIKDRPLNNISVDTENGVDLSSNFGQSLQSGDNGSFGDRPWYNARQLYNEQAINALNGTYDKVIFDVDRYFIDAILDANYDAPVKRAIESLAIYREDFMYFRDMGTEIWTLEDAIYENMDNLSTMFAATYCTAYDIHDPYTRKQITVTIMYDMAQFLPPHMNNGFNLPPAGILHGFIIRNAIEGTVHFLPVVYPGTDEKDELNEARINYASYIENRLVVETLYTSQEAYTQFSFINNVMSTQKVVKAIRRRCPVIRYSFIDGQSLEEYKTDINMVLERYRNWFKVLEMEYVNDPTYVQNKIFYAVLRVCFRDFVQSELFKITAFNEEVTIS